MIHTEKKNGKRRDFLRILFPERCPLCDGLLKRREGPVCTACRGKEQGSILPFPDGFAVFPYSGIYRDAVRRFKYSGRPSYASFFTEAILLAGGARIRSWDPEWIIPVPIHPARRRERGYNQAEEIAQRLAEALRVPCKKNAVYRKRDTLPQNGLSPEERRRNLAGAFGAAQGIRFPRRVLLVDDIYTTGSTAQELGKLLRAHGAEEIHVVCVCVALS